jgi:hypothetical protein
VGSEAQRRWLVRREDDRPTGLLPGLPLPAVTARSSQRRALAAANHRRLGIERANVLAQLGAVLLCLVVLATIAIRGWL